MLLKRYRVELIVDDGSDTASFIIFNKDLTKILKKSPVELINYIVSYFMSNNQFIVLTILS